MGFGEKWLKSIDYCIQIVRLSILINGEPACFLPSERGLKQGDPLSPFLFILAMEGYSSMMRVAIQNSWMDQRFQDWKFLRGGNADTSSAICR